MFQTIIKLAPHSESFITPVDYIAYSDMIYYGTEEEKATVSFHMIDISGKGSIDLQHYRKFWEEFLYMYGELLQVKVEYNLEVTEKLMIETFHKIAHVREESKTCFDLSDFIQARHQDDCQALFEWLDCPGQYIETYLKS